MLQAPQHFLKINVLRITLYARVKVTTLIFPDIFEMLFSMFHVEFVNMVDVSGKRAKSFSNTWCPLTFSYKKRDPYYNFYT